MSDSGKLFLQEIEELANPQQHLHAFVDNLFFEEEKSEAEIAKALVSEMQYLKGVQLTLAKIKHFIVK